MSQRSICSNASNILRHSSRPSNQRFASLKPSSSAKTVSDTCRHYSVTTSSRTTAIKEARPTSSTTGSRRTIASSSRTSGWAPARRLDRAHSAPITDNERVVEYLRELFPGLDFPEDVALRIITHSSWKGGHEGHNARFAFIGRRVLECYLNLFLHSRTNSGLSTPHLFHRMDYDELASKILDTHVLGEYVGSAWKLERIMRWVPSHTNDPSRTLWSSGLYRVRGTTVEAIIGGVFHQFGGLAAHQLFHTRFLPHLSAATVLPISDSIRQAVTEASNAYGGSQSPLTTQPLAKRTGSSEPIRMPLGQFAFTGAKKPFPSGPPRLSAPEGEKSKPLPPQWRRTRVIISRHRKIAGRERQKKGSESAEVEKPSAKDTIAEAPSSSS